jgi:hypothetical protein
MTTEITPYNNIVPNVSNSIVPKNSLFDDIKKSKCIEIIIEELRKIPDFSKYRSSNFEFIKFSVNMIENMIIDRKSGALKKEIILSAFQKLFNLTQPEQKQLSDTIEDLKKNKKIKKIPIKRKYIYPALRWLKKKLI